MSQPVHNSISNLSAPATPQSTHLIVEFYGALHLTDIDFIGAALRSAAEAGGAIVLDTKLHDFSQNNQELAGVTGVVLLAESHISIHTWPEHEYAAIDVFMCGDTDPDSSVLFLQNAFAPKRVEVTRLTRGLPNIKSEVIA